MWLVIQYDKVVVVIGKEEALDLKRNENKDDMW